MLCWPEEAGFCVVVVVSIWWEFSEYFKLNPMPIPVITIVMLNIIRKEVIGSVKIKIINNFYAFDKILPRSFSLQNLTFLYCYYEDMKWLHYLITWIFAWNWHIITKIHQYRFPWMWIISHFNWIIHFLVEDLILIV